MSKCPTLNILVKCKKKNKKKIKQSLELETTPKQFKILRICVLSISRYIYKKKNAYNRNMTKDFWSFFPFIHYGIPTKLILSPHCRLFRVCSLHCYHYCSLPFIYVRLDGRYLPSHKHHRNRQYVSPKFPAHYWLLW